MHHFLYPTQDTFITNISGYDNLNFGLNEILRVGVENVVTKVQHSTKSYPISQSLSNFCLTNFSGSIVDATLYGTGSKVTAVISSSIEAAVSASNFNGTLTGSYWSASVSSSNFTGSLGSFSGSFSGIFSGSVTTGSLLTDYLPYFNGTVDNFTGKIISGFVYGYQNLVQQNYTIQTYPFVNRALLQFDIDAISQSIVAGDIVNPAFTLKMKAAREENLPIQYTLYAFPLLESWVMGDGYFYDGGSENGASWIYRDFSSGTPWTTSGSTYTNVYAASQSFNYEVGDVSMDVTNIVNAWLNGSVTNNGLVVLSGDELSASGSAMSLYFFGEDTNTIYSPYLDVGWSDATIVTGSVYTGSVNIATIPAGLTASVSGSPVLTDVTVSGSLFGILNLQVDSNQSASGTFTGLGSNGTVAGAAIYGAIVGEVTQSEFLLTQLFPGTGPTFSPASADITDFIANYGYFPFVTTTTFVSTPVTTSILLATLTDGYFSGSTFTASLTNNNVQANGNITGSWNIAPLLLSQVSASYPFLSYPRLIASILGPYLHGTAYGEIDSASFLAGTGIFAGTIVDGPFVGAYVELPFSGNFATASFSYTSSVIMASSSLQPMQVSTPFITVVRIPERVKTNEIIKVRVFGREQYPLKNFQRKTQFSQFLTPLYLPASSFYAIKDNETEEIILDFDNYTRLSCDSNGSYFMLDTSGLPQERYMKILLKVEQSGSIYVTDHDDIFKVVR